MSRQQQRVMSAITGANEDDYSSKFKKMQESLIQLKMMEMLYNTGKQQLLIIKSEPGIDVDVNDNIIWARHHHPPTPPSPVPTPTPTVPILGTIAVVNLSQSVTNQQLEAWMAAVKQQADTHVVPWWGYSINYVVIPEGKKPPKSDWYMTVADTIDSPNAAGYHDVDQNGNPIIKVDAQDTPVSVTISHEVCFTGDTLIPLLDGSTVPIKDLVGRDDFWIYSCDNGVIKPGKGSNAKKTGEKVQIVEVTLDNDKTIKCTPDHQFMMRDGQYTEAKDLKIGDSLMPLYRRLSRIHPERNRGTEYEQILNPIDNKWNFTHRMILPEWHVERNVVSKKCRLCIESTPKVMNHRVKGVRFAGFEDVYDFTVEGYHNFALDAGVFVHNCETISDENANTIVTGCMDTINNKPCEMYRESCLTGDTKIALLDGTNVPISQLVGRHHFWVYSIDSNGHIKPGRATNARLTRKDAHVFELTLDNGEVVKATDDHRIMMRDGTFKPVVGLKINDSVMPLYRRLQQITKGSRKDYEQTYDPTSNEWLFTHRIVTPECRRWEVRHHIDFNRFNNSPDNITVVPWKQHVKYHGDNMKRRIEQMGSDKFAEWSRQIITKYNKSEKHKHDMERYWSIEENRDKASKQSKILNSRPDIVEKNRSLMIAYNKSEGHRQCARLTGKEAMIHNVWNNPQAVEKMRKTNGNRCKIFNADPGHRQMLANLVRTPEARQRAAATAKKVSHNRWHLKRGLVNENCEYCTPAPRVLNHKVIGIKYAGQEDVYDITVEGYHNFALSSGMFVHNCDPVENDTYLVNNVQVSNFITKNWFKPGSQGPYDFLRLCKEPCEIRDGGYMAVNYTGNPNGWTQIDKFSKRKDRHLSKGSRHEIYRKRVAKETLKTSTFEVDENWDVRKHNVNQANKQQEAAQQQSEQFGPELMDKIKQFVIQLFTDEEK